MLTPCVACGSPAHAYVSPLSCLFEVRRRLEALKLAQLSAGIERDIPEGFGAVPASVFRRGDDILTILHGDPPIGLSTEIPPEPRPILKIVR